MTGIELTNRIQNLGVSREQIATELFTTTTTLVQWENAKEAEIGNRLVENAIGRLEERLTGQKEN